MNFLFVFTGKGQEYVCVGMCELGMWKAGNKLFVIEAIDTFFKTVVKIDIQTACFSINFFRWLITRKHALSLFTVLELKSIGRYDETPFDLNNIILESDEFFENETF